MHIIVEDVPKEITENKLKKLFSKYGFVEHIYKSNYYDRKGAMALVEMSIDEQAYNAIEKLDGYRLLGKKITVFPMVNNGN